MPFFSGLSYGFHHQRSKDGYNTLDDETTVFPFNPSMHSKLHEPYFDDSIPNNVTALVGKSAYLSCKVRNLGNKTVGSFALFLSLTLSLVYDADSDTLINQWCIQRDSYFQSE